MTDPGSLQSLDDANAELESIADANAAPKTMSSMEHLGAAVTDIPKEIQSAYTESGKTVVDKLNPFSAGSQEAMKRQQEASKRGFLPGIAEAVRGSARVPEGLLAAATYPLSPFIGAARSVLGHGLSAAPGGKSYEKSKEKADTAMMALASSRGVRPVPTPRPPPRGDFGVTMSEGQDTGKLAAIQREQKALREKDAPGHERAQEFREQQQGELAGAREDLAKNLDPYHRPMSPGVVFADAPHEAGAIVGQNVRDIAAIEKLGVSQAYKRANAAAGEIHAGAFEGMGQKIKGELTLGDNPVIIDELTPNASKAIGHIEERVAKLNIPNRADPFGAPNPENITGVSLKGVEQWRKTLSEYRRRAYESGNRSDGRATSAVIDAFDNQVAAAIDKGLFNGDPAAVRAWKTARAAHSDYKSTFGKQGRGDGVGRVVDEILREGPNAKTPNDIADFFMGSQGVNPNSLVVNTAKRLKGILGETSPAWTAAKQGLVSRLIDASPGVTRGPADVAKRLDKFLQADGIELSQAMFAPHERQMLQAYANMMRKLVVPQAGANWSNTAGFLRKITTAIGDKVRMLVGMGIGHFIPGVGPFVGEAAGAVAGLASGRLKGIGEARQVAKQMPLVAEQMQQYMRALAPANKLNSPPSNSALTAATVNLNRSLHSMGIPALSAAAEDQQSTPGPQQENSGGADDQQGFAHGGPVGYDDGGIVERPDPNALALEATRAVIPGITSLARGEPRPPIENLPEYGKVPSAEDPRISDVGTEVAGFIGPGAGAGVGKAALGMGALGVVRRTPQAVQKGFRAWHASPHDFDKLDISKIGTGQGAASYGKGIYAAENPKVSGVGGEYWNEFARRTPLNSPEGIAQDALEKAGFDRAKALEAVRAHIEDSSRYLAGPLGPADDVNYLRTMMEKRQRAADLLANPNTKIGPRVYELNIRKDPAEFLDWDAPLAGQRAAKQMPELLDAARHEAQGRAYAASTSKRQGQLYDIAKNPEQAPGEFAYRALQTRHGPFQKGGPERFRQEALDAGIPGIRYLDQGSRRAAQEIATAEKAFENVRSDPNAMTDYVKFQEQKLANARARMPPLTRNFVLHDTDYVDILRKLGIVGVPAGAAVVSQRERRGGGRIGYDEGGDVLPEEPSFIPAQEGRPARITVAPGRPDELTLPSEGMGTEADRLRRIVNRPPLFFPEQTDHPAVPATPPVGTGRPDEMVPRPDPNAPGLAVTRALIPGATSLARGEPRPPIKNFPDIPGKVPSAEDPRIHDLVGEGLGMLPSPVGLLGGIGVKGIMAAGAMGSRAIKPAAKKVLPEVAPEVASGARGAHGQQPHPQEISPQATAPHPEGFEPYSGDPGGASRLAEASGAETTAGGAGLREPLEGLPQKPIELEGKPWTPGPISYVHDAAERYMHEMGLEYNPVKTYASVNVPRAKQIAKAFEDMTHAPNDPKVQASYNAMIDETVQQFHALEDAGVKFEFIKPGQPNPYEASPRLAQKDFEQNKHLWVYPTDTGFGSGTPEAAAAMKDNPLLRPTDIVIDGKRLLANDVFRIVHDVFGHFKEGSGFRAAGEENAWRSHSAMYSNEARPAMTSETRGQNSWLNYGPYGDKNRTAKSADTIFADQKIGLLPDWAIDSGRFDPSRGQQRGILDPQRNAHPGIYKNPKEIAEEAFKKMAPEHQALKELFGVTREDLYGISEQGRRKGNIEPSYLKPPGARGSAAANKILTPENAQRILDALYESEKRYPTLTHGADAWYVMDPAYQVLEKLHGPKKAMQLYRRFNTYVPMASPSSDVMTEINRGTAANMMAHLGRFEDFKKYAGVKESQRGRDFPHELRSVIAHPYHPTAHSGPMEKYTKSGEVKMTAPKVPLYMQASGVPETGFQTKLPVPDAHFSRGLGMADTRTDKAFGRSMKGREYHDTGPWYRENVATPLGIEAVPAQARQWTVFGPQTGVDSPLGAPKLELLAQSIWERAKNLGIDPKKLRDAVLSGNAHASIAAIVGGLAAAAQENRARGGRISDPALRAAYNVKASRRS